MNTTRASDIVCFVRVCKISDSLWNGFATTSADSVEIRKRSNANIFCVFLKVPAGRLQFLVNRLDHARCVGIWLPLLAKVCSPRASDKAAGVRILYRCPEPFRYLLPVSVLFQRIVGV